MPRKKQRRPLTTALLALAILLFGFGLGYWAGSPLVLSYVVTCSGKPIT
jgi:Sec-independent protein secretion pathway component TatC